MRMLIVGDGGWGTAFALTMLDSGHDVTLFSFFPEYGEILNSTRMNNKFLPGFTLPKALRIVSYHEEFSFNPFDCVINAVPTQYVRPSFDKIKKKMPEKLPLISLSKGLEMKTSKRVSQVLKELLPKNPVMVLSGPSHAEEVARKLPTVVTLAGLEEECSLALFRNEMSNSYFRVYSNNDLIGAEFGGALKNVIGLAAGMVDGLGYGDNTKSALITRGLVEIIRFGISLGAEAETFYGLSGLGDLITTSISDFGRNWWFGKEIGKGRKKEEILSGTEKVVEGIYTVQAVKDEIYRSGIEMPICEKIYEVIFEGLSPKEGLLSLMTRDYKEE